MAPPPKAPKALSGNGKSSSVRTAGFSPAMQTQACLFPESAPDQLVAGLDEAGRGCLAGPVVASAIILRDNFNLPGLADSKQLSPKKREILAGQIRAQALTWGLGAVWPWRIDEINILGASLEAMAIAASKLSPRPSMLLIDGNQVIKTAILDCFWQGALPRQKAIIRGDQLVNVISAASILAKTWRDRLMGALAKRWPGYGFEIHKGYPTKAHRQALTLLGPCRMHRRSFRGCLPEKGAP